MGNQPQPRTGQAVLSRLAPSSCPALGIQDAHCHHPPLGCLWRTGQRSSADSPHQEWKGESAFYCRPFCPFTEKGSHVEACREAKDPHPHRLPSLSFSFSSFLLFLAEDLLCPAGCPAPEAAGAEAEVLDEPEEEAADRTLLPHRAQDSSCRRTGDTPSSTRKLTCSKK